MLLSCLISFSYALLDSLNSLQVSEFTSDILSNGPAKAPILYSLGSRVLTERIPLHVIYYGSFSVSQKETLQTFLDGLSQTAWWNVLGRYFYQSNPESPKIYVNGPMFVATTVSNNYTLGKILKGNDIPDLIQSYIDQKIFSEDSNAVYLFLTAADVKQTLIAERGALSFCEDYCGFHLSANLRSGKAIQYAHIGNADKQCLRKCSSSLIRSRPPNNDVGIDAMVSIIASVLAGTITDPFPTTAKSWQDENGQEIGDKCAWSYGDTFPSSPSTANVVIGEKRFLVQKIWDPIVQGCVQYAGPFNAQQCEVFRKSYSRVPFKSWGKAPETVKTMYAASDCDAKLCQAWKDQFNASAIEDLKSLPKDIKGYWESPELNCNFRLSPYSPVQCQLAVAVYNVIPGISFGNAPGYVDKNWNDSNCNNEMCKFWTKTFKLTNSTSGLPKKYMDSWTKLNCPLA